MADCRITHIRKKDRMSSHEYITHAGSPPAWYWTREQIIKIINDKTKRIFFHVST